MPLVIRYLIAFLLISSQAFAANIYVRDGGTATGSSGRDGNWNAASCYDQLSSAEAVAQRGDIIYVADGTYGTAVDFNVAASGSTYIYIKKATTSAHGTETGWSSSYGDGSADFTNSGGQWDFETGYWDVDGVVGEEDSGHGFVLTNTGTAGNNITVGANYIYLRHIKWTQPNYASATTQSSMGLNIIDSGSYGLVQYCHGEPIHRDHIHAGTDCNNWTIEHSFFAENHSNCRLEAHGQAIYMGYPGGTDGWTIRYNTFKNINGSAVIFMSGDCDNHYIYGNLFYQESDYVSDCGLDSVGGVLQSNDSNGSANNLYFYNNTIARLAGRGDDGTIADTDWTGSGYYAYNNIWYGCDGQSTSGWTTLTNDINPTNPFVNYSGNNFKLAGATSAGTTLSSPYNSDFEGDTRGGDGTWDRGYDEFTGEDTTPPTVSGRNPESGETGVLESTNIVVHVTDSGDGVNSGTIVMTVEGSQVTPSISGTGADYTLTYNPPSDFSYDQVVNVTIDADDNNSNSMTQDSYSFTIRSAPDTTGPVVNITTPADNPHLNGSDTTADLAGTASDAVGVASVAWTCATCTPSSGSATGTTSWTISNITISEGNNSFVVTATDTSDNTGYDSTVVVLAGATPAATLSRSAGTAGNMSSGASD